MKRKKSKIKNKRHGEKLFKSEFASYLRAKYQYPPEAIRDLEFALEFVKKKYEHRKRLSGARSNPQNKKKSYYKN